MCNTRIFSSEICNCQKTLQLPAYYPTFLMHDTAVTVCVCGVPRSCLSSSVVLADGQFTGWCITWVHRDRLSRA